MYVYIYMYTNICIYMYTCINKCINMYTVCVYVYMCIYTYMYTHMCTYVCYFISISSSTRARRRREARRFFSSCHHRRRTSPLGGQTYHQPAKLAPPGCSGAISEKKKQVQVESTVILFTIKVLKAQCFQKLGSSLFFAQAPPGELESSP